MDVAVQFSVHERLLENVGKSLFNKISGPSPDRISQGNSWEKDSMQEDDNKDCREI